MHNDMSGIHGCIHWGRVKQKGGRCDSLASRVSSSAPAVPSVDELRREQGSTHTETNIDGILPSLAADGVAT
jgi:hypothetical protein